MKFSNFRTYFKFLGKNKLYTVVNIVGFSVSLMFVFLLGAYVIQELSVDKFHEKKDRIYLMANSPENAAFGNAAADFVKDNFPEVENYARIVSRNVDFNYEDSREFYTALFADSSFFNLFSFELIEGNPSQVLTTKQSAVLTESFANKIFPGIDPIGKTFQADGSEVTVTGIARNFPKNTIFPQCDFILSYSMIENYWGDQILQDWGNSSYVIFFLEKEGADLPSKADQLTGMFKESYWIYKGAYYSEVIFVPFEEVYFSSHKTFNVDFNRNSKSLVYIYFAITILILVIAILNYINLSVSQVSSRGKEAAIKKLLGSSKKMIISQFISESVLMAFLATVIGIVLAFAFRSFFNNALDTQLDLTLLLDLQNIVLIIIGIFIIGIISGLFPALVVSRFKPIEVVKGSYSVKVKTVYSKILITFQYIVAIGLLICSVFLIKQTNYMKNYNLGYNKDRVFIMQNVLDQEKISGFKEELLRIPGVEKVSYSAGTPLDGGNNNSFQYNGEPVSFQVFYGDSAFFDIYGIELFPFDEIIPNSLWLNPKGYNILQPDSITHTIFGNMEGGGNIVSGTTNEFNFKTLHNAVGPAMLIYVETLDYPWSISVEISSGADPFKTADLIKNTYTDYSGGKIFHSEFADDVIQKYYQNENKVSRIIIAFTILTIVILMMGILAMSLYYVRQKEKEIAIRKVNGAEEKGIIYMLNMNFIKWITLAFIIAVPLSYFIIQKWFESFAYKITMDWWVFVLAGLGVVAISVIFVTIQSWKTATSNPINSLKNE